MRLLPQYVFDISDTDFNPIVFYACKQRVTQANEYHDHEFTTFTYILSGQGKHMVDGRIYTVAAGDLILCNPGSKHQNIVECEQDITIEFITGFTGFHFKGMPPNHIGLKNDTPVLHFKGSIRQEITKHCNEILEENRNNQIGKYFMVKAHLIQIILLILREEYAQEQRQAGCHFDSMHKKYIVDKMILYMNENFTQKISLDRIAENMYLSPVYISKIFKEETGESPINYLIRLRLEKAKEILEKDDRSGIKEVAYQVGYEDVYHFSKMFKKYFGLSPSAYRKQG